MTYSDEAIRRQLRLGEDSSWEFKAVEFAGKRPKKPPTRRLGRRNLRLRQYDRGRAAVRRHRRWRCPRHVPRADGRVGAPAIRSVLGLNTSSNPSHHLFARSFPSASRFLLVEVPEGYGQHDSPGGSFHRSGSSKRRMSSDERLRLAQRRGTGPLSLVRQTNRARDRVSGPWMRTCGSRCSVLKARADPQLALEKMGLLAADENGTTRATVAGMLLCNKTPEQWLPNACITATRYRGADRASGQLDAQTIGGPLDRQITEALAFAVRNMRVAARKEPAREDLPQYSKNALFEALVNAIVPPRLLDSREQDQVGDVRGPRRTLFSRRPPQQSNDREHGRTASNAQRSADLGAGPDTRPRALPVPAEDSSSWSDAEMAFPSSDVRPRSCAADCPTFD